MLTGSLVAIVTPMQADGALDIPGFKSLLDWHIAEGTDGIVVVGTTGESPTVDVDEHCLLIKTAVEHCKGRIPIIAGTGGNSTREAIELTKYAKEVGADYSLSVVPYYNKPTQEGMFLHFTAIADAVDLPMFIYNIPPRSVIDMTPETMGRLAKHRNIVGVKDATANLARPLHTKRSCGEDFIQLSGEDHTALAFNAAGGVGCISVTANVAPRLCAEMHKAWRDGRLGEAMAIQDRLVPLHDALFSETSPGPVKYAASLLAKSTPQCRLPLAPVGEGTKAKVREAMVSVGLLN